MKFKAGNYIIAFVIVFICILSSGTALADLIGSPTQTGWSGTSAGVRHFDNRTLPSGEPVLPENDGVYVEYPYVKKDDKLMQSNVESDTGGYYNERDVGEVTYTEFDGDQYTEPIEGEAAAQSKIIPYGFHGHNHSDNFGSVDSGGFFRDELYYESASGSAGYLEFDFDISFFMQISEAVNLATGDWELQPDTYSRFLFYLLTYTGDGSDLDPDTLLPPPGSFSELARFDWELEVDGAGNPLLNGVEHGPEFENLDILTLSTQSLGHFIQSGSYVPLSFCLWTYTKNGTVDWPNTVMLDDVRVYDEVGKLLGINEYSLISQNNQYFNFENEMPNQAPVPEPATILLLGSGLIGLAGFRKKFKKS